MTREVEFHHFNGSLFLASLWLSRQTRKRCPNSRESARISILEEGKDLFSNFAPEVEEFRRGFGTGKDPNFDGVGSKVSDLKCEYALVGHVKCFRPAVPPRSRSGSPRSRLEFSVRRLSSRRRVARAPRSIKVLIEMWFRSFKAKSRR